MRAVILSVLVVFCAVAFGGLTVKGGLKALDENKWGVVANVIERSLVLLETRQGEDWELQKLTSVQSQTVSGINYVGDGEFKDEANQTHNCHFTLWVQELHDFDELKLTCGGKEYVVTRGSRPTSR